MAALWASVGGVAALSARLVAPRSRAHWPALSSSMSAVSLTEAASEADARSRLALRKTYPEMPMPKTASSETAATRRLRILQTVPPCADALIAGISRTPQWCRAAQFERGPDGSGVAKKLTDSWSTAVGQRHRAEK